MLDIQRLSTEDAERHRQALAEVLLDCVKGGASVNFLWPFSLREAEAFFEKVIAAVQANQRVLLAAFLDSRLVGTVQIVTEMPPNQPHRAEIAKLLVHRSARGQGVAGQLMREAESIAKSAGKTLLVLDTASAEAERVYIRGGWTRLGAIPDFCLLPDGTPCDTVIFWKRI